MEIYAVKINGLTNPVGYLYDTLICTWRVRNSNGKKQSYAKIKVALDERLERIVWERCGEELSSLGVLLDMELAPRTRYFYRITVESDAGERAESEVCYFETGKREEPWRAKWIGANLKGEAHPEFHRQFDINKSVTSARLYICGLGMFEAYLNGEKVGSDLLAPFINDYDEHVQYCTYDVTDLITARNELRVMLGNGWYRGHFGLSCTAHYERPFALIAECCVEYSDGSEEVITTDENWRVRRSVVIMSDIYGGEIQDYTLPAGRQNPWRSIKLIEAPSRLVERYSPPLKAIECLPVKELIHTPKGDTVLDFGQNFAGYVECTQQLPKGVIMTFEVGEVMQKGEFYHDNYRTAKSVFRYISDGEQRVIRPFFTFFGFRYVRVSGIDNINVLCFTGRAVHSQMEQTGRINTGNKKVNRLHENVLWGLKSNFIDMPTDCPQRDERVGWTGDTQVFTRTAGFLMDTRAFYEKFLRDLRSDQLRNNGKVAIFLPNEFCGLCASVWSDIATLLPDMLFEYYGDKEALERHYPLMKDWVDSVRRDDQKRGEKHLWDFGFQFGDWVALDGATEQSRFGRTDPGYISSVYYFASTKIVADTAALLGKSEAGEYSQLASDIRNAILDEYFTASGRLAIDTQTGYLIALRFGVYRDRQRIVNGLRTRIKKDCGRIKGGFVGATMMNTILADNGMADLAYDFLMYEGFPGWLYAVNLGATTIWERWNSLLPDGTISGSGMNSLNHYAYGSVIEFLYRCAAGISAIQPGFKRARIAPLVDGRLGHLECSFDSAAGRYVSNWTIGDDGHPVFHIEIPFDCTAEVLLPEQELMILETGSYDFSIQTKRDYLAIYDQNTPMERLIADKRAVDVLESYLPGVAEATNLNDIEALSRTLADMRYRAVLFRTSTDAIDAAITAVSKIRQIL